MSDAESENDKIWTAKEFRPYISKALDLWKKGELYITTGIGESDPILSAEAEIPNKGEKGHPYNKLLEVVSKDVADDQNLEKKVKKNMTKQLKSFHDEWAGMIKVHKSPVKSKPTTTDAVAGTDTAIETKAESGVLDHPDQESEPGIGAATSTETKLEVKMEDEAKSETALSAAQITKKIAFEKEKERVLDKLPSEVKARFGQQVFAKWGKNMLPCLVMNPFHIPPGPVRSEWLRMYAKVETQGRLSAATNLVYWYGSHRDLPNAYSLIVTSKLLSYEAGIKKGYGEISKPTKKKLEADKKMSAQEKMLIEGLGEMKIDLKKDPSDRQGYLNLNFEEEWQYVDEVEEMEEVDPQPMPQQLKKRKNEDDQGSNRKKKKSTTQKGKKKNALAVASNADLKPNISAVDIEDIGDDDLSSHDDKDDLEDADLPSESDEDDEAFEYATAAKPKTGKKKKGETKKPPKKKGDKVKTKIERKPKGAQKKVVSENERRRKLEQQKFTVCEDRYLKIIKDWKYGLEQQSKGAITEIYGRLLPHVTKFCASFIEVYEMPALMKRSRKIVDNENRVQLWKKMKEVWTSKRLEVPEGFVPQKRREKEEAQDGGVEVKEKAADTKDDLEAVVNKGNSTPLENSIPVEQKASSAPKKLSTPTTTEKKKKFSLGSIMTKPRPSTASKVPKADATRVPSSSQMSGNNDRPTWISASTSKDIVADATRSFALEFLQQAAPFIPPNEVVNHDAIARELEASIYTWAGGKEGESTKDWLRKYWEKIDDLVAAISGNEGSGTIALMISQGKFRSATDVVMLSENDIACSFEGRPLEDYDW